MPVYRPKSVSVPGADTLVDELAAEIRSPSKVSGAPVIYEDEVPQTRSIHVLVIWDKWAKVPGEKRGTLILDAYEAVDEARSGRIRFAIGVTFEEAIRGGFLPYKIEPTITSSDKIKSDEVRAAMADAGAWDTPAGLELRFPYRWLADQVLSDLHKRFEEHTFALVEEVGSVGDWAGKQ